MFCKSWCVAEVKCRKKEKFKKQNEIVVKVEKFQVERKAKFQKTTKPHKINSTKWYNFGSVNKSCSFEYYSAIINFLVILNFLSKWFNSYKQMHNKI